MRFDNAFLTKAQTPGMQFVDNGDTFTVWKDNKGNVHVSEHASVTQKAAILAQYWKRHNQYMPKKAA